MSDKETLIKLIQEAVGNWMREDIAERIADHLIKNGVVIERKL